MSYQKPWASKITQIEKNKLTTYGYDQCELMESFSYEEMVYLLIFGKRPSELEKDLLRAIIIAYCSHGITGQSTLAVRMAADCGSSFQHAAMAGFSVGSGIHHQGALQASMEVILEAANCSNLELWYKEKAQTSRAIPGYGHRFHSKDPRARALVERCDKRN